MDRRHRSLLETKLCKTIRVAPEQAHNQVLGLRSGCQTSHARPIEHIGQKVARYGGEQETRTRSVTQRLQIGRVPGCQNVGDKQVSLQSAHQMGARPQQLPKRSNPSGRRCHLNAKATAGPCQRMTARLTLLERGGQQLNAAARSYRTTYGQKFRADRLRSRIDNTNVNCHGPPTFSFATNHATCPCGQTTSRLMPRANKTGSVP